MLRSLAPLLLLGLVACSDQGFTRLDNADVWIQEPSGAVDVLLIIDDSCSMAPHQAALGSSFAAFIQWFVTAGIDYQIAVVTTDGIDPSKSGRIQGEIMTPDTPNPEGAFTRAVSVGISGSRYERGLEMARRALTEPLISNENSGFLRDYAALTLVFVSDEDDKSPWPVHDYVHAFRDLKPQEERRILNASALVVDDVSSCPSSAQSSAQPGQRYMDVARQAGGVIGDICAQDFQDIAGQLGLNASRMRNTYFLSSSPNLATLQVSIDEEPIGCDEGVWRYEEALDRRTQEHLPAIVFAPDRVPPVGAQIVARYMDGVPNPDDFCRETS
ncbi:MAG: hypothetical protein EA397_05380 [Deltaproteobacteria bacterium]|nr:MAG: hypothetical protein EA397_05380 [Deltaproteobacteria bacterium]